MNAVSGLPENLPPHLALELTTKCNYQCPFCYCLWHEFPEMGHQTLNTDEWKDIIDYCVQNKVKCITFTGGEVLLRPDIFELLEYTVRKSAKILIILFSNGSLLDEAKFLFCKKFKISISTSLQGLRSHESMTGTLYGYRKTLELIAFAHQEKWPVDVSIIVNQVNRNEIKNIFAAAALCGASSIQLGPMMPEGRGKFHLDMVLSQKEWENVKQEIRNMKDYGVPYVFSDEILCQCRSHPAEINQLFPDMLQVPCDAGKQFGVIGPDGKYRKCLHCLPV